MHDGILDIDAGTTIDIADGHAVGPDWQADAAAVVNVETPETGGTVELRVELDAFDVGEIDAHVDSVSLTPHQARLLATALEDAAFDAEPSIGGANRTE